MNIAKRKQIRRQQRRLARRRRGVLLLVVLSMLVLFMMIGTAFLLTSSQFRAASKESAKQGRTGNFPTELLDRALYQVLRDTTNPFSAVRYHSLLRDMYGTDGFEAVISAATYARHIPSDTTDLGATQGQLIDLYVVPDAPPGQNETPEPRHVLSLERDEHGLRTLHAMPLTDGYYNGTLLTIVDGPARGQSARVVEYAFVGDNPDIRSLFDNAENIWRLRIMAINRADGMPLNIESGTPPNLPDLQQVRFIVNGRPFNGTGVGYNVAANAGLPRLSALMSIYPYRPAVDLPADLSAYADLALTPNSTYYFPTDVSYAASIGARLPYGIFPGPGGADESYDAADFQNMFLAHETVTPTARGRVVQTNLPNEPFDPDDRRVNSAVFARLDLEDLPIPSFHRPALMNYWFHRLVNQISGGNPTNDHVLAVLQPYGPDGVRNNGDDPGVDIAVRDQIVAVKRKISLRPLKEDHPNFDGSNPLSVQVGSAASAASSIVDPSTGQITIPYWEAVGPWDVDNDNDGIPDSNWVDLGDPVQQAENGTLYKPLYAFKIIDLDSRLNVNAHGSAEHINPPQFDPGFSTLAGSLEAGGAIATDQMPQGTGYGTADISLRPLFPLPTTDNNNDGMPDFVGNRTEAVLTGGQDVGKRDPSVEVDNYAALLAGRTTGEGLTVVGRYGFHDVLTAEQRVTPGTNYAYVQNDTAFTGDTASPDAAAQFKFFDYPLAFNDPSSFGMAPDMGGRYALGIDHFGQPAIEAAVDVNPAASGFFNHLLANSPYELDLSRGARRGAWAHTNVDSATGFSNSLVISDDAAFPVADMERLLRAHDAESAALPSRLWDVVDAFDPNKLIYDRRLTPNTQNPNNPDSLEFAAAAQLADINRRIATTDSWDPPVPSFTMPAYVPIAGADGAPGNAGEDDDGNGTVDDYTELGAQDSDDFQVLTGRPYHQARLVDLLVYRIQRERIKAGSAIIDWRTPAGADELATAAATLLPRDVLNGLRMDINRPFGNGQDDDQPGQAGFGVIDEPSEGVSTNSALPGGSQVVKDEPLWDRNTGAMNWPGVPAGGVPLDFTRSTDVDQQLNSAQAFDIDGDDAQLARQLYARHLYVLMMLLVDEEYVATQNAENPNLLALVDTLAGRYLAEQGLTRDQAFARAENLAVKKLTARRIAQWAINCADFRDPDAIMTPFEYDENPFDGWGVQTQQGFRALDGDPRTNENWGRETPFPQRDQTPTPTNDALVENATRAVVWGAERPELLITETFAFHDRRATDDEDKQNVDEPHGTLEDEDEPDDDLDQRLKPRGSLFVELYNPHGENSPRPAELYRYGTGDNQRNAVIGTVREGEGVLLNRLSDIASADGPSPVWRMIVVEDPASGRLTSDVINVADREDVDSIGVRFRTIDTDSFGFNSDKHAERYIYFTTGPSERKSRAGDETGPANELEITIPPIATRTVDGLPGTFPVARRYFIARTTRPRQTNAAAQDMGIAPILPGRYAVIGPSSLQLDRTGSPAMSGNNATARCVTPIGRQMGRNQPEQSDAVHTGQNVLARTRRIELWPDTNPFVQQVLIDDNGGSEFIRAANPMNGDPYMNATDPGLQMGSAQFVRANPQMLPIQPAVAIPIEDLNISEPVEGYPSIRYQQLHQLIVGGTSYNPPRMNNSGEFEFDQPYDTPMDMQFELVRNGTTSNYRSIHLQRLANPLLPWNPPPFDEEGDDDTAFHNPDLPVNPYLTVDSMSADLTAFNGVSVAERDLPSAKANQKLNEQGMPQISEEPLLQGEYFAPLSAEEIKTSPDHVLAGLLAILVQEGVIPASARPSIDAYRQRTAGVIQRDLDDLERERVGRVPGGNTVIDDRNELLSTNEPHGGQWGWHKLRRFLPDDEQLADPARSPRLGGDQFKQTIHLRSLERGGHHRLPNLTINGNGWVYDPSWQPRLLWKQERPNGTIFSSRGDFGPVSRFSDLVSSKSRRLLDLDAQAQAGQSLSSDDISFHDWLGQSGQQRRWAQEPMVFDFAMDCTLGFTNRAYAPEIDFENQDEVAMFTQGQAVGAPEINRNINSTSRVIGSSLEQQELKLAPYDPREQLDTGTTRFHITPENEGRRRERILNSTYPWLAWYDRPYVSNLELLQVPASSSSLLLREYSVVNPTTANPYDGDGTDNENGNNPEDPATRLAFQNAPFGHLMNFLQGAFSPAAATDTNSDGVDDEYRGAPNYQRILEFLRVPSRYVNTETMLNPTVFGDANLDTADGMERITNDQDPRYYWQPPFNRVDNFREPGRVNLNTVSGRRVPQNTTTGAPPQVWSEVYDGMMHRLRDGELYNANGDVVAASHFGPAWRDVVLSRRGYAHFAIDGSGGFVSMDSNSNITYPDAYALGLNRNFPTFFANPFRAPDAGDLVPLNNMLQLGVNASLLRAHPFNKGTDSAWGRPFDRDSATTLDDDDLAHRSDIFEASRRIDDTREAGFNDGDGDQMDGDDMLAASGGGDNFALPNIFNPPGVNEPDRRSGIPLFSESLPAPHVDAERNPSFFYQPLTRLGNLATTRSGVFAIWVTVGFFEVEPAPDWNDDDAEVRTSVRERFGGNNNQVTARQLYDRVYPEGYALGRELGIDTGDARRHRAFYIVDRTLPVGFKPGEDLNVENIIRLRRRIE